MEIHVLQIGHDLASVWEHVLGSIEIRLGAHDVATVGGQHSQIIQGSSISSIRGETQLEASLGQVEVAGGL